MAKKLDEPTLMVPQVADILGISQPRVHQLIKTGRLKATRLGHYWMIRPSDVEAVRVRVSGWPKGRKRGNKISQKVEKKRITSL